MRDAYLGLLKLCLCDLEGSGTSSVGQMQDGRMFCRELRGGGTSRGPWVWTGRCMA